MIRLGIALTLLCATLAFAQQPAMSKSMFRLPFPSKQTAPILIPSSPEDTTLIELPYAIEGWSGRGFAVPGSMGAADSNAANATSIAGDFMLYPGDLRGYRRFTVTPLVEGASRTLHIFLAGERTLTLEIFTTPQRDEAFKKVTFVDVEAEEASAVKAADAERARRTQVTRSDSPPESRYIEPSEETQRGLQKFMRMILNMPEDMAQRALAANQYLRLSKHDREIPSGDYTINIRFAVRDSITDSLGICVALRNNTNRRLVFDPRSWIVRAGDQPIPIPTVDFAGVLEPNATVPVFLVVTRGIDGRPTRLLPENDFTVAVSLVASTSAKPVELIDLNTP